MVWTEWSRFTNDELLRLIAAQPALTPLEVELANRLAELEEHVEELTGDEQQELPLQ